MLEGMQDRLDDEMVMFSVRLLDVAQKLRLVAQTAQEWDALLQMEKSARALEVAAVYIRRAPRLQSREP